MSLQDARGTQDRPQSTEHETLRLVAQRSYRYVRASMVGLLLALAVAVVHQSAQQDGILASISAYYYTPAQAVFVGALIGLGVAMIALHGTTDFEDVVLNLGGMLAPVIAVVPTSRGADFRDAVEACRTTDAPPLTARGGTSADCPTVRSLVAATRANVENNMVALFVVGGIALVATLLFAWIELRKRKPVDQDASTRKVVWGFGIAALLYLAGLLAFLVDTGWFVEHAHFYAAAGLFVCIVLVVVANAVRRHQDAHRELTVRGLVRQEGRWYLSLAAAMVAAAVVLGVLTVTEVLTLFWLEAVLIGFFAVFWVAQTWEQWDPDETAAP